MAHKILLLKFLLLLTITSTNSIYAQFSHEHYDYKSLDINNIVINPNNIGRLETDPYGVGAYWNLISPGFRPIVYDIGPWIVGKIEDSLYAVISQWWSLYSPGPIVNGQAGILINPQDSLKYRVYKISEGDDNSNIDFAEWPSDLGAPTTLKRSPLVLGDQTIWTIYNGVDSTLDRRNWWTDFEPLPVEIQQTIFAHSGFADDNVNIFSNVVFIEWTIINKGDKKIDSTYFGFWTDIDFTHVNQNFPAVDTTNQLAYCWNRDSSISVGFSLLYGPIRSSTEDIATFKGKRKENFKNLPMTSFHGIGDDSYAVPLFEKVSTILDVWNFARGLDINGNIIIDPTTNDTTFFPLNGDPVTNQGWLYPLNYTGGGAGFVFFSGPFDMEPQDTQWVMIALIPASGDDPFNSITNMREKAQILHSLPYDSLAFGDYGLPPEEPIPIPEDYLLYQNYPNPFNQGTIIKYELPSSGIVSLKIYDILGREVAKLVDEIQNEGGYSVGFNPSSLASGVYLYRLRVNDFVETKKMVLLK
jgi:hypothetical protein